MFHRILATLLLLLQSCQAKDVFDYCLPTNSSCWPSQIQWHDLKSKITGGKLHDIGAPSDYETVCQASTNPYTLEDEGEGRCMQYHHCSKERCEKDGDWNLPEFSVEASTEEDIVEAIRFANTHNIQVVVKTTGHNYAGSSTGYGALLIWMRNYQKYGNITTNHTICEETYPATLKIGGGQVWEEAYTAVGNSYHIIGGGCLSVSAAGGWLSGAGLSASARLYGLGIDQVLNFEVVLANGSKATASRCENPDLFWALRGGGGGTFGVTTSVHFKLHTAKPFCYVGFLVLDFTEENDYDATTLYKWLDYFVDSTPSLSRSWGGYWGLHWGTFFFEGTEDDLAEDEFLAGLYSLGTNYVNILVTTSCDVSYLASRGYPGDMETDQTGLDDLEIANRLIPLEFVRDSPEEMKDILKWMVWNGFWMTNYMLGGQVLETASNATAVHPAMRQALFQMIPYSGSSMIEKLRLEFPDSGVGLNHAAKDEPDWRNQLWGSNLERLEELKRQYDPDNRFNCWHCVGYLGLSDSASNLAGSVVLVVASVLALSL